MDYLIPILILGGIAAVTVFFLWRRKKKKAVQDQRGCPAGTSPTTAEGICLPPANTGYQIDRPDGGWIIVYDTKPRPSDEACQAAAARVSAGIANSVAEWRRDYPNNSRRMMNPRDHGVVFIPKMATNMDGTPALVTSGIQTAGTVINIFPETGGSLGQQTIILPIPDDWTDAHYLDYLEASAHNEDEHVMEYNNDLNLFLQLMGAGDVHPHRQPIAVGLVGGMAAPCGVQFTMRPNVGPMVIKR